MTNQDIDENLKKSRSELSWLVLVINSFFIRSKIYFMQFLLNLVSHPILIETENTDSIILRSILLEKKLKKKRVDLDPDPGLEVRKPNQLGLGCGIFELRG